jgi:hypothetical protein
LPRFHHLWIVEAELEIRNPSAEHDTRCEAIFEGLSQYASDETEPYPTQVARNDDGWLEVTFPVWAPTRWAAMSAGATVLAEVCNTAGTDVGVARLAVGESSEELAAYRNRIHVMENDAEPASAS